MKTLIIYAHPHDQGHNAHILKEVKKQLKPGSYEVLDLYKMKFDQILRKEELYKSKEEKVNTKTKQIQEKIRKTNKLVFIFPIWWNGVPAILKGFFDRILTAGFAFKYRRFWGMNIPMSLLNGKKAALFYTTGSNKLIFKLLLKKRGINVITKDTVVYGAKFKEYINFFKNDTYGLDISDSLDQMIWIEGLTDNAIYSKSNGDTVVILYP